jgi:NitT/TauT family transport system ATP-binding protein
VTAQRNLRRLNIGFIPLLDCATIVAAAEKGFAAGEDLDLRLARETSWANIRDRVVVGHFDAAHMLGPMVVASTLGIGHFDIPLIAPMSLGLGGNTITVSGALWSQMSSQGAQLGADPRTQGMALARAIAARNRAGHAPLTFAMVYPFSCHNYELRYWLAVSGVDPDKDLRLIVLPPPLLVDALRSGQIDGFCVGEPWGSLAVEQGIGCIATFTSDIWRLGPEKVLGCREQWARRHPDQLASLIRALHAAARWCELPANHEELAQLLSQPRYVGVHASILLPALAGQLRCAQGAATVSRPDFLVFARQYANLPWPEHAAWFYSQMVQWGQTTQSPDQLARAMATYRPDIYREALLAADPALQLPSARPAGVGQFFDNRSFDPAAIDRYLSSFA